MTAREMVDMKLHETKEIGLGSCNIVLRVPGGWVYFIDSSSAFVPLDYEFVNKADNELYAKKEIEF